MKTPFKGDYFHFLHYSIYSFLRNYPYDFRIEFQMNMVRASTCFLCRGDREDDISDGTAFLHSVMMHMLYDYYLIFNKFIMKFNTIICINCFQHHSHS